MFSIFWYLSSLKARFYQAHFCRTRAGQDFQPIEAKQLIRKSTQSMEPHRSPAFRTNLFFPENSTRATNGTGPAELKQRDRMPHPWRFASGILRTLPRMVHRPELPSLNRRKPATPAADSLIPAHLANHTSRPRALPHLPHPAIVHTPACVRQYAYQMFHWNTLYIQFACLPNLKHAQKFKPRNQ